MWVKRVGAISSCTEGTNDASVTAKHSFMMIKFIAEYFFLRVNKPTEQLLCNHWVCKKRKPQLVWAPLFFSDYAQQHSLYSQTAARRHRNQRRYLSDQERSKLQDSLHLKHPSSQAKYLSCPVFSPMGTLLVKYGTIRRGVWRAPVNALSAFSCLSIRSRRQQQGSLI